VAVYEHLDGRVSVQYGPHLIAHDRTVRSGTTATASTKASRLSETPGCESSHVEGLGGFILQIETLPPSLWDLTHWARTAGWGAASLLPQSRSWIGARVASPHRSTLRSGEESVAEPDAAGRHRTNHTPDKSLAIKTGHFDVLPTERDGWRCAIECRAIRRYVWIQSNTRRTA
jgi:hypothetical protein